jgi:diguanylate cyclase (GGDEF)-like protein/PAS domain S-box-containing protein
MPIIQNHTIPLRILFIEDVENDVLLLVDHLQSEGLMFDWQRVDTEYDIITKLQESWDIIFSDYSMPHLSGTRALEIVRQYNPDIPFIFVSGTIGEGIAVDALKCGAQDYVMKGNLNRLLPAVDRELREAQQRREYRQTEQAHARLVSILDATPDLVAIFELDGCLRYLNGAGRQLLGLGVEGDISKHYLQNLFLEGAMQREISQALTIVRQNGVWNGETILRITENGELPVSQVILAHRNTEGSIEYLSTIMRDISERKHFEAELQHQATHDRLTDLPNRFFLVDRFVSTLEYARRRGKCVGVLFLDLDNFKRVNDSLGHAAGDNLLQQVAIRLKGCLRSNDTIARHGGDEFTIIASDLENSESVLAVLHKLYTAFECPVLISSQEIYITFSIGIALYPHDGDRIDELLHHADVAMYRSKSSGPNQYRFYAPDMNARSHELLTLEANLRHALEREEFLLHYQPQFSFRNNCIIAAEGLIRWLHPTRGLVSPADFVPLLENSGMIIPVGEWVLHQACRVHRNRREAGFDNVRVSINVSAAQFNDAHLLDKVRRALQDEQMPQQALELEITENILMEDPISAVETLQAIHALGVRIAIDDFGTGYSYDPGDAAIVEASISLAHKFGLEVVAEGVETAKQYEFMSTHSCDMVQGYYLSRPLSWSNLTKFLQEKGNDSCRLQ